MSKEKKKSTKAEDAQGMGLRYSFFKAQAEHAVRELDQVSAAIADISSAKVVLEDLEKGREGEELLIPIGGSSFIDVRANDVKKVLVGVGANVIVQKPTEDAIKNLDTQLEILIKREKETMNQLKIAEQEIEKLAPELAELQKRAQKG